MAAFLARPLDDKVLPILLHSLAPLGIRLVSLAFCVTADLAARAVATWRVIHGYHLPTAFPAFPLPSACAASNASFYHTYLRYPVSNQHFHRQHT